MVDVNAENESRAFFASKNVDIAGIDYSLKTAMASLAQFKSR